MVTSVPPMVTTRLTTDVVPLNRRSRVPVRLTPGTVTATTPVTRAAVPVLVSTMMPLPSVIDTTGWPPAVIARARLVAAATTTGWPASSVVRSSARSARRVWPPTVSAAPTTSTRRYGPAGRPSASASEVFTATETEPRLRPGTAEGVDRGRDAAGEPTGAQDEGALDVDEPDDDGRAGGELDGRAADRDGRDRAAVDHGALDVDGGAGDRLAGDDERDAGGGESQVRARVQRRGATTGEGEDRGARRRVDDEAQVGGE